MGQTFTTGDAGGTDRQHTKLTFWKWPGENDLIVVSTKGASQAPAPGLLPTSSLPAEWFAATPLVEAPAPPPPSGGGKAEWDRAAATIAALYQGMSRGQRSAIAAACRELAEAAPDGPASVDLATIGRLQASIDNRRPKVSAVTRNNHTRHARTVCGWLVELGFLARSPFAAGKRARSVLFLREPDSEVVALSATEVRAILDTAAREAEASGLTDRERFAVRRLRALVVLLAYTGVRAGEALQARVRDLDLDRRILWVRPHDGKALKTAKSAAPVPLPEPARDVLRAWISDPLRQTARKKQSLLLANHRECLFPTAFRDIPWTSGCPGYRPLDQVAALARRAGIEHRVNLKTFRHTWASQAEAWGFGPAAIQRVLRHTTTATQRHYRKADLDNLAAWGQQVRFG